MRVVIVDFNHMVHIFMNSPVRFSIDVSEYGQTVKKDTTVQACTIKNIHRWSNHGTNPTAVCFDRATPARKAWFSDHFDMKMGTSKEYKGTREKMSELAFEGIADTERLLRQGGVSCFANAGYEADDLISACIDTAKIQYPGVPIDVVTNDADLLPLVDETVSIFLRSVKSTYAVDPAIQKSHYVQVTPDNFSEVVEGLSAYKGFHIPYNAILLHKLVRGDTADNINGIKRQFSPKKWNSLMSQMEADGVDFAETFRYGKPVIKILNRETGEEFEGSVQEALNSPFRNNLYQKIYSPIELENILSVLKGYGYGEDVETHVTNMYWGMNLNQIYPNANKRLSRFSYSVDSIERFNDINLQKVVSALQIRLSL